MCLAIPGQLTAITEPGTLAAIGCVAYGEIRRQVSLALLPEARIGDWLLVHAGIAMTVIDAAHAAFILAAITPASQAPDRHPARAAAPGSATASATTQSHPRASDPC